MSDKNSYYSSREIQDILELFDDGFLFERFAQEFLSARLGQTFLASGGIKDRGIDGLEYTSELSTNEKHIFQMSINKGPDQKIADTVNRLRSAEVEFSKLTYVTNLYIKSKDTLINHFFDNEGVNLGIYDGRWMSDNENYNHATMAVVQSFIDNHLRKFKQPGEVHVVYDYVSDPRLYVFLRQQIDNGLETNNLNNKLIDSLVLYSLRNTDPDKNQFLSVHDIHTSVGNLLSYALKGLEGKVKRSLKRLSKKPNNKINHHRKDDVFCLPWSSRKDIVINNVRDISLYNAFQREAVGIIKDNLKAEGVKVNDVTALLHKTLEKVYYRQGLDFSNFLLNDGCDAAFESSLSDTVQEILEDSQVIQKNRPQVAIALILAIRELVYNGSHESKDYLVALSKTYQMLFLLKCEPRIVEYFQSIAGSLNVYVCNSIIVPALSEIFLAPHNQRYWGLLKAAKSRGVTLLVNDTIIKELVFHINRSLYIYERDYQTNEDFYRNDGAGLVDQILVRAYFYALKERKTTSYRSFLNNFLTPNNANNKQEIIDLLYEEFGVQYVADKSLGVSVDQGDFTRLVNRLTHFKKSEEKAKTDARLILLIYSMREKNSEKSSTLDGYRTWWLSSDTSTHKAIVSLFKDRFPVSCYMRPDFLYNYISLSPSSESVADLYKKTFPNMLGLQISNHVSRDISSSIREVINEHSNKLDGRRKAQLRTLVDELKSNPKLRYQEKLKGFFDQ